MPILRIENLHKSFGLTRALAGVDLRVAHGSVHALIGENGAGKSTLLNIISGLLHPDRGSLELEGRPYRPASPGDARKNGIALIHQELSLCPDLTVWENILLGVESSKRGWLNIRECHSRVESVLQHFSHPDIHPDRPVETLSIAARQVVEICRALAFDAQIILMDEPTSSLQREDVRHLFELIGRLKRQQITVIYISHFLEEVRQISDTFTVLRDGHSVASGRLDSMTDDELIRQMVGRPVTNLYPRRSRPAKPETLLAIDDFSAPPSLHNASLTLRAGEILGIAGLMGAGRTALVRALVGLQEVRTGNIRISSVDRPLQTDTRTRISQGFGYLSEDRAREGLLRKLSIADNVTATRYTSCSSLGWIDSELQRDQTRQWVEALHIRISSEDQPVSSLSGGNQQKVAIARLLHQKASILLLDEPTRGIDIGSKAEIYRVICQLADEGNGVLLVSSYLPELFGLCDLLAVMTRGVLSETRPIKEWTPETVLQIAIGKAESATQANVTEGNRKQ